MSLLFCVALVAVFFGCDASALALRPQAFEASDLLTSLLAHKSAEHLLLNLACLVPAGMLFERRHGSLAFLVFSLLAGVLSSLCEVWTAPEFDGAILGASGIGLALFGAFAFTSRFTALISMAVLVFLLHGALTQSPGIAHYAHLGGYALGLLWSLFFCRPAEEESPYPHPLS